MRRTAVIIDVDGTLCDVRTVRHHLLGPGPKDFDKFHTESIHCPPHQEALDFAVQARAEGHELVVVTARMYRHEMLTRVYCDEHLGAGTYHGPFMRGDRDVRPDVEVKRDIHCILTELHGFEIVRAIDDNPRVVELWRSLGIPVVVMPGWCDEGRWVPPSAEEVSHR